MFYMIVIFLLICFVALIAVPDVYVMLLWFFDSQVLKC